jgi:outer membrane protein assembly factor BamE (lipoprotein component of BamABCDE complex)
MKTFLRFSLSLLTVLTLCQCATSTPQSRIERNPQIFSRLGAKDRELVTSGVIREGMTQDAVFLAWGSPDRVSAGRSRGKDIESWYYVSERPVRTFNMNMGFGYGAWSPYWGPAGWGGYPYWGGGPSMTYVPYTTGVVEFTSGCVTSWMATPR